MPMTLIQFQELYQKYIEQSNQSKLEEEIENFVACYQSQFPRFPNHNYAPQTICNDDPRLSLSDRQVHTNICYNNAVYSHETAKRITKIYTQIQPTQIVGNTWLFSGTLNEMKIEKLTKCLYKYTYENTEPPAIVCSKISTECYFTIEGNHRIYTAFLLNKIVPIVYYEELTKLHSL